MFLLSVAEGGGKMETTTATVCLWTRGGELAKSNIATPSFKDRRKGDPTRRRCWKNKALKLPTQDAPLSHTGDCPKIARRIFRWGRKFKRTDRACEGIRKRSFRFRVLRELRSLRRLHFQREVASHLWWRMKPDLPWIYRLCASRRERCPQYTDKPD